MPTRLGDSARDASTWHSSREPAAMARATVRTRVEAGPYAQARSKETLMTTSGLGVIDRRMAIGGALAGAAGLALPHRQSRTVIQRGMVGGGLVQFEQGEANFSVFRVADDLCRGRSVVVVGSVLWVDETVGLTLEKHRDHGIHRAGGSAGAGAVSADSRDDERRTMRASIHSSSRSSTRICPGLAQDTVDSESG